MADELPSHLDEVTPAARTIGKRVLWIDRGSGEARLEFFAAPDFANRSGTVGGGFLAAMLDSSAATPLLAQLPPELVPVTTELHVSFLKGAPLGVLRGVGRLLCRDDRDAETEAEISTPDGTIVARATAKFRILRRRR